MGYRAQSPAPRDALPLGYTPLPLGYQTGQVLSRSRLSSWGDKQGRGRGAHPAEPLQAIPLG